MCGSMVDIQSAAAEIRRGKKMKKEKRKKIETTGHYYIGRPQIVIEMEQETQRETLVHIDVRGSPGMYPHSLDPFVLATAVFGVRIRYNL